MKTSLISVVGKGVSIGILAIFLANCGGHQPQQISGNKDEPKWVNNYEERIKVAKSPIAVTDDTDVVGGDISYATNNATMKARAQIASMIKDTVDRVSLELKQSDGQSIAQNSLTAYKSKAEATLQKSELVERWIDRSVNPNKLYVLVRMDKEAFEKAMKDAEQILNINPEQAKILKDAVEEAISNDKKSN